MATARVAHTAMARAMGATTAAARMSFGVASRWDAAWYARMKEKMM